MFYVKNSNLNKLVITIFTVFEQFYLTNQIYILDTQCIF